METISPELSRSERSVPRQNYRKLADLVLPRPKRNRKDNSRLYPIDILERRQEGGQSQIKIHYVGYSSVYDEWREASEVYTPERAIPYIPYSLYADLASRIKASLALGRKADPEIRIDMPFDKVAFDGGLRLKGKGD